MPPAAALGAAPHQPQPIPLAEVPGPYYTATNASGLYKIYPHDGEVNLEDLCDSPCLLRSKPPNRNADPPGVPAIAAAEAKEDTSKPWRPLK